MIKTDLCELLDLKYPIFQGGMAWIADASLAAAVSNAGGLGIIAAMNADAKWLREEIHKARQLTERPFGVNVMLMSPFADEVAQVVVEEKVPVVVTGAGNPGKYMKQWVQAGIKVIPVVASTAMARMVERSGAFAVIAEGGESGGHIGELTTMTLVPQVCDAVKIPVLAAGGIADGRGIAAALMLGARRTVRNPLSGGKGVYRPSQLQGKDSQGKGHRHHRNRKASGASGALSEKSVQPRAVQAGI